VESKHQSELDFEAKKLYKEKLKLKFKELSDPYGLSEETWIDDVTKVARCSVWRYL